MESTNWNEKNAIRFYLRDEKSQKQDFSTRLGINVVRFSTTRLYEIDKIPSAV